MPRMAPARARCGPPPVPDHGRHAGDDPHGPIERRSGRQPRDRRPWRDRRRLGHGRRSGRPASPVAAALRERRRVALRGHPAPPCRDGALERGRVARRRNPARHVRRLRQEASRRTMVRTGLPGCGVPPRCGTGRAPQEDRGRARRPLPGPPTASGTRPTRRRRGLPRRAVRHGFRAAEPRAPRPTSGVAPARGMPQPRPPPVMATRIGPSDAQAVRIGPRRGPGGGGGAPPPTPAGAWPAGDRAAALAAPSHPHKRADP